MKKLLLLLAPLVLISLAIPVEAKYSDFNYGQYIYGGDLDDKDYPDGMFTLILYSALFAIIATMIGVALVIKKRYGGNLPW